jgi:hypothetical protein
MRLDLAEDALVARGYALIQLEAKAATLRGRLMPASKQIEMIAAAAEARAFLSAGMQTPGAFLVAEERAWNAVQDHHEDFSEAAIRILDRYGAWAQVAAEIYKTVLNAELAINSATNVKDIHIVMSNLAWPEINGGDL